MTEIGKQQRKADAGDAGMTAAGRTPRAPAPGSPPAGRSPSPQGPRAPEGQRKPGAASDDDDVLPDIDDEEE